MSETEADNAPDTHLYSVRNMLAERIYAAYLKVGEQKIVPRQKRCQSHHVGIKLCQHADVAEFYTSCGHHQRNVEHWHFCAQQPNSVAVRRALYQTPDKHQIQNQQQPQVAVGFQYLPFAPPVALNQPVDAKHHASHR